jgi:hypothetical protein
MRLGKFTKSIGCQAVKRRKRRGPLNGYGLDVHPRQPGQPGRILAILGLQTHYNPAN